MRLLAITIISAVLGNEIPNKREPKLLNSEGLVLAAVDGRACVTFLPMEEPLIMGPSALKNGKAVGGVSE